VLVVVLDTSTAAVTAAVVRIGATVELVAEEITVDARAHGERLAPGLAAALAAARIGPAQVSAVVAGLGPGPFTGLRVGLVTAAVFADALGLSTYGVCSLDGLGALTTGTALVATDARRKEVYWAGYVDGVRLTGPAVNRPSDVPAELARAGLAPTYAVGEGALAYAGALGLPARATPAYPSALALARSAADRIRAGAPGETLTPLYLRRPDAVEPARPKAVRT
jgi:tRNA threonylcarbamoyl adenosine modification protein YeaZ